MNINLKKCKKYNKVINLKIGIPRALLYYKYGVFWKSFFNELGFEVVISEDTNKEILKNGIRYSIDENCLAAKVFMGHVYNLLYKVDYIFVPRFCTFKTKDAACVKFNALYDICVNIFGEDKFLTVDIDYDKKNTDLKGYIKLGRKLGKNMYDTIKAYMIAKNVYRKYIEEKVKTQDEYAKVSNNIKILIVSHPYVIYDKYLGDNILSIIKNENIDVIYADTKNDTSEYTYFSKSIYWKHNKELISNLKKYINMVDGVIFVSVFPCGIDALVNEICMYSLENIPKLNIVIDESEANAGQVTRLESFIDILNIRKKEKTNEN